MAEKKSEPQAVAETAAPAQPTGEKKKFDWASLNTLSVVSLASAISIVGALVAVITGHIALKQIKQTSEAGRTLALTGVVLGYLHLAGWIIFGILGVIAKVLIISGAFGLQPMGPEYFEFERGFGGMHFGDR
ncbi:MAG: hypothetical protein RL028_280 [Actinomycetota bacterium]|jgi:lysylphosphatidylglycerol synthetase-like protein (DUF2156 family)